MKRYRMARKFRDETFRDTMLFDAAELGGNFSKGELFREMLEYERWTLEQIELMWQHLIDLGYIEEL